MSIFTPRAPGSSKRFRFELAEGEQLKIESGRIWGPVQLKLKDGRMISARSAPCGMPGCYCDAVLLRGPS